ncbi:ABC transporter permease subunit [Cellulomonas soli]|uniref:ABC transporter permease subunit n=1 Tax=Cellulomonas soli TaxID=931535 RepID=UPI003F844E82
MRLLRTELERFRCRAVLWLVTGLLLLAAVGSVILAWDRSAPPGPAEVAAGRASYESVVEGWQRASEQVADLCEELTADPSSDPVTVEMACDGLPAPLLADYLPTQPTFEEVVPGAFDGMTIPLAVAALAMGVSFVAAEFATGSMSTWLTFVPRRGRVVVSKTAGAAVGVVPVLVAAQVTVLAGGALVFLVRGVPPGDATLWADLAVLVGRQLVLAVLAAVVGAALAFALRHAAAVTGALVWWFVAVEVTLPVVLPQLRAATVGLYAQAWAEGAASYSFEECVPDPGVSDVVGAQVCTTVEHTVGGTQGLLVLLVVEAVLVAAGLMVFRRRDVA